MLQLITTEAGKVSPFCQKRKKVSTGVYSFQLQYVLLFRSIFINIIQYKGYIRKEEATAENRYGIMMKTWLDIIGLYITTASKRGVANVLLAYHMKALRFQFQLLHSEPIESSSILHSNCVWACVATSM